MSLEEQIQRRKAYIRYLYKGIELSGNPFFIECMFHCIETEKAELRKCINMKK